MNEVLEFIFAIVLWPIGFMVLVWIFETAKRDDD